MNKANHSVALAPGFRAMKFSRDWITRPVFGVLLAAAVIAAIFTGRPFLEIVVAAAVATAAREWHRMVGEGRFAAEFAATTAIVWLALLAFFFRLQSYIPQIILAAGTLFVLAVAWLRRSNPLWHAGAVLYLGVPALAVLTLRDGPPHGVWIIVGLFLIVWATDTGALFAGNMIGGPKLWPALSPNKTWSGTIGGIVAAAAVEGIFIAILGGGGVAGVVFGAAIAVTAHMGDLFESLVKRRFHIKDSGSLIPGHGGVLDRIDSTLFAAVAMEVAVLVLHIDPLFGAFA